MLRCEECRCDSETGKGWLGYIAEDPEDGEGPTVCVYCPPCASASSTLGPLMALRLTVAERAVR